MSEPAYVTRTPYISSMCFYDWCGDCRSDDCEHECHEEDWGEEYDDDGYWL